MTSLRLAALLCFTVLAALPSVGQEGEKPLTIDEIVARHEATWAKLTSYSLSFVPQGEPPTPGNRRNATQDSQHLMFPLGDEFLIHRNGDCYSISPKAFKQGARKEFLEAERYVVVEPTSAVIRLPGSAPPAFDRAALGAVMATNMENSGISLRTLVERSQLTVQQRKNASGEPIYVMTGKVKVRKPVFDEGIEEECNARITVNAARGYLIEEYAFEFERRQRWFAERRHSWRVMEWSNNPESPSLPKSVQFELKIWWSTEKMLSRWIIQTVDIGAQEKATAMQCQIPTDAVVEDRTGRSDATPFAIWGDDGKPRLTFPTEEAYDVYRIQEIRKRKAEGMRYFLAAMFPGQNIDLSFDDQNKFKRAVVKDSKSEIVREFESEGEVVSCLIAQGVIVGLVNLTGIPRNEKPSAMK